MGFPQMPQTSPRALMIALALRRAAPFWLRGFCFAAVALAPSNGNAPSKLSRGACVA